MIRNFLFSFFLMLTLTPLATAKGAMVDIVFHTKGAVSQQPYLICGQQLVKAEGSDGRYIAHVDIDTPSYITLYFSRFDSRLCYIEPGRHIEVSYSMPEGSKSLSFTGDLSRENTYLQQARWAWSVPRRGRISPSQLLARTDSLLSVNLSNIHATDFSTTFKEWECRRAYTESLREILSGMLFSDSLTLSSLESRFVKDASYLRIPEYLTVMDRYVRMWTRLYAHSKSIPEGEDLANLRLRSIREHVKQADIAGYLVDITLFPLAELGIERYHTVYHEYVKDPARIALYDASAARAKKMEKGQPFPNFTFYDYRGRKVSLADLRGKIVFIDIWATWCGPCRGEMPALKKIEKQFEGRGIEFVSLSVDKNKDSLLWKKTIHDMQLGGIQLILGEQWDWIRQLMPTGISVPRCVLIDRQGRFIDAHAPRPSSDKLIPLLEKLVSEGDDGIVFFNGTFEQALAKAKAEQKLIFMDCYASWCGPCRSMEKNVFTQKKVGDYFNHHFISMKCNMEKDDTGRALKRRFDVVSYPTLLFITPDGFASARRLGFTSADSLLAFAAQVQSKGFKSDEKSFAEGRRDIPFLHKYISTLLDSHQADAVEDVMNKLYSEQGISLLKDSVVWTAFVKCAANRDSPLCRDFVAHYPELCRRYGDYAVDQKVRNLYASFAVVLSLYDSNMMRDTLNVRKRKALFDAIDTRRIPQGKELKNEIDYLILLKAHDYSGALKWGKHCLKKASPRVLCNWAAWGERMVRNDKSVRTAMAEWADKAANRAGANAMIRQESVEVAHDLRASEMPVSTFKGLHQRYTIPVRGY